jgi:hypothetical protein
MWVKKSVGDDIWSVNAKEKLKAERPKQKAFFERRRKAFILNTF